MVRSPSFPLRQRPRPTRRSTLNCRAGCPNPMRVSSRAPVVRPCNVGCHQPIPHPSPSPALNTLHNGLLRIHPESFSGAALTRQQSLARLARHRVSPRAIRRCSRAFYPDSLSGLRGAIRSSVTPSVVGRKPSPTEPQRSEDAAVVCGKPEPSLPGSEPPRGAPLPNCRASAPLAVVSRRCRPRAPTRRSSSSIPGRKPAPPLLPHLLPAHLPPTNPHRPP